MSETKSKKQVQVGPIRHNLEAFGVAILAAVLLKWFCIEAYQIPTSSMQPTLMGSNEANVYDRILVNKWLQTVREPQRYDTAVFKYPLQKNQNYVKRIGGVPGDRLSIGGGNLYQVAGDGDARTYSPLRKPDDLQEDMWKNVFPLRMQVRSETQMIGESFGSSPPQSVTEREGAIVLERSGKRCLLYFRDRPDGGMIDRLWDGYPLEVARLIRNHKSQTTDGTQQLVHHERPQEIVPDVRLSAEVEIDAAPKQLSFEILVTRPGYENLTYALVLADGQGVLEVREGAKDGKRVGASEPFPMTLPATVAFAHVDDQLIAWRDGDEQQRFDCSAWQIRDGCTLPFSAAKGLELPVNQKVTPQFACTDGKVTLRNIRIDRDQHYVQDGAPDVIEVPTDHYYMLGDNTLQSVDSRGWTAITVGVDADNNVVPPDSPAAVRTIRGNKRPMRLENPPDRDETPIAIPGEGAIVMIDEYGEILRLNGMPGEGWGEAGPVRFRSPGDVDGSTEFAAPETTNTRGVSFVPRADIEGRALLVFYPCRPLSWLSGSSWPDRFGFVR